MKKSTALSILILLAALVGGPAFAQHYGHSGVPHIGGHYYGGGGVRFGVIIGTPGYLPGYYPYYAPRYYYVPPVPPVYIQQVPVPAQAAPVQPDWYYCADAKAYYPYVRECPAGWQRVPAQSPR